jgi:hypothetical protein
MMMKPWNFEFTAATLAQGACRKKRCRHGASSSSSFKLQVGLITGRHAPSENLPATFVRV